MASAAPNMQWYIARSGKRHGPLSELEMQKFIELGHLKPTDLVWRAGMSDWRPASAIFPPSSIGQRPAQPDADAKAAEEVKAEQAKPVLVPAPKAPKPQSPAPLSPTELRRVAATAAAVPQDKPEKGADKEQRGPAGAVDGTDAELEAKADDQVQGPDAGAAGDAQGASEKETDDEKLETQPIEGEAEPTSRKRKLAMVAGVVLLAGGLGWLALNMSIKSKPKTALTPPPELVQLPPKSPPAPAASEKAPEKPAEKAVAAAPAASAEASSETPAAPQAAAVAAPAAPSAPAAKAPDGGIVLPPGVGLAPSTVPASKSAVSAPQADAPAPSEPAPAVAKAATEVPTAEVDRRLQTVQHWKLLKREFPEWYGERLKDVSRLSGEGRTEGEVVKQLTASLVALRRKHANDALAADGDRLNTIATSFLSNMKKLEQHSEGACYGYISQGESGAVYQELIQKPEFNGPLNAQSVAIFDAVAEGRRAPRKHPAPGKAEYDALAAQLTKLGWKPADLQLFADPRALAKAGQGRVCKMVQDWFAAHIAIPDKDVRARLLTESLRPVVSG